MIFTEGLRHAAPGSDLVFLCAPGWVPAGHAVLFLTSLVVARSAPRMQSAAAGWLAISACGLWAAWSLLISDHTDRMSLFLFCLLLVFRRHPVVAARIPAVFVICAISELVGVLTGAWAYRPPTESGWLTIGNPPAAIAGGYCFIDYCALLLGAAALKAWRKSSHP